MDFLDVRIEESEGLILAHSLPLADRILKKGRRISPDDIAALRAAQVRTVAAVRLGPDDVGEDEAAAILAERLMGPNIVRSAAFTGRVNLFSAVHGLAIYDRDRLDKMNLVDEAITVATVPPFEMLEPRQVVATVKVIPLAVDRRLVEACAAFAGAGTPLLSVQPFQPRQVGLILTELPRINPQLLERTALAMRERVESLGSAVVAEARCAHNEGAVERTIAKLVAQGCDFLLISGATATVDRRDVVPRGIERAGGQVEHFGMPVDPGNLLLLAYLGPVPIVDMPGCARTPKLNGLDWVLRRLLAGQRVSARDIMLTGAGGLLKDLPMRATRRDAQPPRERSPRQARFAAVIPATIAPNLYLDGAAALQPVSGRPMLRWVVEAALASRAEPVVMVAAGARAALDRALDGLAVRIVETEDPGLLPSLAAVRKILPPDIDGVLICPDGMTAITARHFERMMDAFDPDEGRGVCLPVYRTQRGHPQLWALPLFDQLARLPANDPDALRRLMTEHVDTIYEVVFDDPAVVEMMETPCGLDEIAAAAD